ncbi:hypothetical protein [Pelagibacterium sediminicola]|uniref:hypothetical protein n=1 Tax=Pelagibacterium sediminicola TaxID=2248761 RepID=UPI000E321EB6|nr:hypothetical protein [Pelagibacterium sediminicola]
MLSKPIASGIMLTAIILLGGGALLQQDGADEQAGVVAITPEAETAPERAASAPSRVVDSAGFPVVPEDAADEEVAETRPIVTVNGRPLNGGTVQPAPEAVAERPLPVEAEETNVPEASETVAVAEPPRPIPRPEGLAGPRQQPIDYDAIAAIAHGEDGAVPETGKFMSLQERQALVAPQPRNGYLAPDDPRRQGLVAVVGPDGEPIWIYEEQMRAGVPGNSGARFSTRRVQSNPYGFVYEDYYGW